MSKLRLTLAFSVAGLVAACGGKVVVDLGTGNTGGSTGTAGGGLGGLGGFGGSGGVSCFNPPDPATLSFCSGGVGSGGSSMMCENDFCDADGNVWAALCESTTCQCLFNNDVVCTCALNGPGDFCFGTPTCCPLPKL